MQGGVEADAGAMTIPASYDDPPLPKRAPRGLLPSTWLGREVKLEYDPGGGFVSTNGRLLDWFGCGLFALLEAAHDRGGGGRA